MYVETVPVKLTITIGVAPGGDEGGDADQIIDAANAHMMRAKRAKPQPADTIQD
jgi:PleD family two-component response regulator